MYYNFNVKLIRNGKVIETAIIKEYDGDCLDANLLYDALDIFEAQDGDIIATSEGNTLIRLEDDGFHYICI